MPTFRLPLSGDVTQTINPWNWFMRAGQIGLVNIDLGSSADPALEARILEEVGSYGRQLGRIGDALGVLLDHLDTADFTPAEHEIIADLRFQLAGVERLKRQARA